MPKQKDSDESPKAGDIAVASDEDAAGSPEEGQGTIQEGGGDNPTSVNKEAAEANQKRSDLEAPVNEGINPAQIAEAKRVQGGAVDSNGYPV